MNNILNNLFSNLLFKNNNLQQNNSWQQNNTSTNNKQNNYQTQNTYPQFNNDFVNNQNQQNSQNYSNFQNSSNFQSNDMLQKLLPMLLSGKGLNDILPNLQTNNPLISSILNTTQEKDEKKLESDVIDTSSLSKIN